MQGVYRNLPSPPPPLRLALLPQLGTDTGVDTIGGLVSWYLSLLSPSSQGMLWGGEHLRMGPLLT